MRSRSSTLGPLCLAAALLCVAALASGETTLYKWVDADGVTHFSDRPVPGAQRVKVAAAQTYKAGPAPAAAQATSSAPAPSQVAYQRLEITSPTNGEVYWNTGGHLDVSAVLEPELADGHQLWFVIDGKSQPGSAGGTTSLEIPRGEHTMTASVTDASGNELISSSPVSFVVKQTAMVNPQTNATAPKPTPHR